MKLFQKKGVAIAVMVAAVLLAVVIGQVRKPDISEEASTVIVGNYTYVYDYSGVMSDATMKYIDAMNMSLFAQTGGQIMVQVVDSTGSQSIEEYAVELGNRYQVGDWQRDNGLVLVLALENISSGGLVGDYWVEPGDGIFSAVDELDNMCYAYLEKDFAAGRYDAGVRKTFDAFIGWYEDSYGVDVRENYIPAMGKNFSAGDYYTKTIGHVETSAGSIVSSLILVMFLLLIIWIIVDAIRWNRYRTRYMRPGMGTPTVTYYPVFWGRPRRVVVPPRPQTPPRNTRPPSAGSFGGGYRPSGGSRPSSGRSSFGGGGSFGNSSSRSRSGGRSGGSFGGSSRGGRSSFGGGGSFGGSRGGRMGGGRSGGRGR